MFLTPKSNYILQKSFSFHPNHNKDKKEKLKMKKAFKLLSLALCIILAIGVFTTVASAENHVQSCAITTSEYYSQSVNYIISGLRKDYPVEGNYIGYGYANSMIEVEAIQAGLEKIDYYYSTANCNANGIDGLWGPNTYRAVKAFQVYVGLSSDGIVGPNTWFQLESWTNNQH